MSYNDTIYVQDTHHYSINPRGWGRAKYYILTYPRIIHVTRYHNNIHTMRVYGRIIIFVPTPQLRGLAGRMPERAVYSPETMCSRSPSFRQPPAAVVTQAPVELECGPPVTRVSVVVVSAITWYRYHYDCHRLRRAVIAVARLRQSCSRFCPRVVRPVVVHSRSSDGAVIVQRGLNGSFDR